MRHETLKTEPRKHSGKKGIKVHDKNHERLFDASEKVDLSEIKSERKVIPLVTDLFENMERMMEEAWHRPMFGFGMPLLRNFIPDFRTVGNTVPAVDMFEENGKLIVKAELPGVDKKDLNVFLEGRTLTITGKRESEERVDKKGYVKIERSSGTFTRVLTLPDGVDLENVEANLKDGLLVMKFPEIESDMKTKTINVN